MPESIWAVAKNERNNSLTGSEIHQRRDRVKSCESFEQQVYNFYSYLQLSWFRVSISWNLIRCCKSYSLYTCCILLEIFWLLVQNVLSWLWKWFRILISANGILDWFHPDAYEIMPLHSIFYHEQQMMFKVHVWIKENGPSFSGVWDRIHEKKWWSNPLCVRKRGRLLLMRQRTVPCLCRVL